MSGFTSSQSLLLLGRLLDLLILDISNNMVSLKFVCNVVVLV